jgi:hypothetical protein
LISGKENGNESMCLIMASFSCLLLYIENYILIHSHYVISIFYAVLYCRMNFLRALYLQLPASIIFTSLLVYTGLTLNAKYGDSNPVPCIIKKHDQVNCQSIKDKSEDTKVVIRSRKSKDRQYNSQMKENQTDKQWSTTQYTKTSCVTVK